MTYNLNDKKHKRNTTSLISLTAPRVSPVIPPAVPVNNYSALQTTLETCPRENGEGSDERITSRCGLALYAEFMKAIGVDKLVSKYMPAPGSGKDMDNIATIMSSELKVRSSETLNSLLCFGWHGQTMFVRVY